MQKVTYVNSSWGIKPFIRKHPSLTVTVATNSSLLLVLLYHFLLGYFLHSVSFLFKKKNVQLSLTFIVQRYYIQQALLLNTIYLCFDFLIRIDNRCIYLLLIIGSFRPGGFDIITDKYGLITTKYLLFVSLILDSVFLSSLPSFVL